MKNDLAFTYEETVQRLAFDFLSNFIFLTMGRVGSSNLAQKVDYDQKIDKRSHLMQILHGQLVMKVVERCQYSRGIMIISPRIHTLGCIKNQSGVILTTS